MTRGAHQLLGDIASPEAPTGRDCTRETAEAWAPLANDSGLQLITLHLARCADYPQGSDRCGYAFVAPLTPDGHLDTGTWLEQRKRCYTRRFWEGEPDRLGRLVHPGGAGGATRCFEYTDVLGPEVDAGHHLQEHRFVPGEYLSILQDADELKTFKVADVRKACLR
jgi:hypothetical protein